MQRSHWLGRGCSRGRSRCSTSTTANKLDGSRGERCHANGLLTAHVLRPAVWTHDSNRCARCSHLWTLGRINVAHCSRVKHSVANRLRLLRLEPLGHTHRLLLTVLLELGGVIRHLGQRLLQRTTLRQHCTHIGVSVLHFDQFTDAVRVTSTKQAITKHAGFLSSSLRFNLALLLTNCAANLLHPQRVHLLVLRHFLLRHCVDTLLLLTLNKPFVEVGGAGLSKKVEIDWHDHSQYCVPKA